MAGVVVTVTSAGISDIAFAGLAGATKLNHGDLPYGHLTSDLVHGDTYQLTGSARVVVPGQAPVSINFHNVAHIIP